MFSNILKQISPDNYKDLKDHGLLCIIFSAKIITISKDIPISPHILNTLRI